MLAWMLGLMPVDGRARFHVGSANSLMMAAPGVRSYLGGKGIARRPPCSRRISAILPRFRASA